MNLRAHWRAYLQAAGMVPCRRCGKAVTPGMAWDVGHIVDRVFGGPDTIANTFIEHRTCNQRAGSQLGARLRNARRVPTDRNIRGF